MLNNSQLECPRCHSLMRLRSSFAGKRRAKCEGCGYFPFAEKCIKKDAGYVETSVQASVNVLTQDKQAKIADVTVRADIDVFSIETTVGEVADGCSHYFIPDLQCRDDEDLAYCSWIGGHIADVKPDVIINIGDHADMASLSYYDKGTAKGEGRRVCADIESAIEGMNRLLRPIYDIQQAELKEHGEIIYKPRMILTLGNHEHRINRHVESNPALVGFLSTDSLRYKDFGWEVYDFLVPAMANGVAYAHFFANPLTGRPYGGTIMNVLKNVGESFSMGHVQKFDMHMRYLPATGRRQMALVCGAAYPHDEDYKGPQGNHHFRGTIVKTNVSQGGYDIALSSLSTLKELYG